MTATGSLDRGSIDPEDGPDPGATNPGPQPIPVSAAAPVALRLRPGPADPIIDGRTKAIEIREPVFSDCVEAAPW
ncbi:MAG: hypothetical protein HOQ36_14605 [Nocardia sp.]|nr:hypothetical protein [Nocardia sp.]